MAVTTTTQIDPAIQPFLSFGLGEARKLYESGGPKYFEGQTYVSPSETTLTGLQALEQRAMQGSPLMGAARGAVQSAIQGQQSPAAQLYADIFSRAGQSPTSQFYTGLLGGAVNPAMAGYAALTPGVDAGGAVYRELASGQTQNPAMAGYAALTPGVDAGANVYRELAFGQNQNPAMAGTQATASGQFLAGNPFFQGAFNPAAQAATQQFQSAIGSIASQASKAGRYGSGAMERLQGQASNQLAQQLANTAGQLAFQNYSQERGLQEAAMGRVGALSQQDIANRMAAAQGLTAGSQAEFQQQLARLQGLGAVSQQDIANRMAAAQGLTAGSQSAFQQQLARLQGIGNLSQQDIANRMAAAQGLGGNFQQALATQLAATGGLGQTFATDVNRQLTAAGMVPGMSQMEYQDIQNLLAAGQAREGYTGQQLASDIARFNFLQNAPQQNLANFLNSVYGNPLGRATTTTQGGYQDTSTLQNVLGTAATLGGLYKNLGGAQGIGNLWNSASNWLSGFNRPSAGNYWSGTSLGSFFGGTGGSGD